MPKPLKSLLIVFSLLVVAGILALSWDQWPRPAGDAVVDAASSGSGQASQPAGTGSGPATTADSGTTGEAPDQSAESEIAAAIAVTENDPASSATGDRSALAATESGADGAAAKADKIAALIPDIGAGSGESLAPEGEAGAALDAPDVPDAIKATAQPSFDIVRVEPTGDTIVAGRAAPGAKVELLSNGSVVATTTADAAGEFVLVLEKPLAAGGHDLALRTSAGEGVSIYSRNNVAVAVPEDPSGEVLVVMNEPGAASEILAKPDEAASVETGIEIAAMGETVIAVAPSLETLPGETQIAAASAAPAAQPQAAEPAEPAANVEPETPPQTAETAPAAPVAPEPRPQTAETAPMTPVAPEPRPQMVETAPAAPLEPESQPQMVETAAVDKPAERSGDQVADGGQATAEVASPAPVPLAVEAVEVEGGRLYAAGTAKPGAIIRLYIDDEPIGEAMATDSGRWLLETEAKVPAGTVIIRADQLAPETSNVIARAEVPFTRQLDMAILIPTASSGAPAGVTAEGELPNPNAVIIRRGDNLWTISRRTYGRGIRYTTIYTANKDQIRNPHLIFPGQVFVLPVGEKSWTQ